MKITLKQINDLADTLVTVTDADGNSISARFLFRQDGVAARDLILFALDQYED